MKARTKAKVAAVVLVVLIVGAFGLYYRAKAAEQEAASLDIVAALLELTQATTLAKQVADAKSRYFIAARQFDQTMDGKAMFEAAEVDTRGWPKEKVVVIADEQLVKPFGSTKKLLVVDAGSKSVTMNNSNAFRSWQTTEYFKHFIALSKDEVVATGERVKAADLALAEARRRRSAARFLWEVGEDVDVQPSGAPPVAEHGDAAGGPAASDAQFCRALSPLLTRGRLERFIGKMWSEVDPYIEKAPGSPDGCGGGLLGDDHGGVACTIDGELSLLVTHFEGPEVKNGRRSERVVDAMLWPKGGQLIMRDCTVNNIADEYVLGLLPDDVDKGKPLKAWRVNAKSGCLEVLTTMGLECKTPMAD